METCDTAALSAAETAIRKFPETVEPERGFVIETTGGILSVTTELLTFTSMVADPTFPAASEAFTMSVCVPFATFTEFQANENGDEAAEVTNWLSA